LLSNSEVETLLSWDRISSRFRLLARHYRREKPSIKDTAFREVYGELIRRIVKSRLPHEPWILKTDLWNEGVENGRNILSLVRGASGKSEIVGVDISGNVCGYARRELGDDIEIVRSTLLAPPFCKRFDLIIDISTVDHIPKRLRERWISNEASLLKENGVLLISFDCKLNIFCEVFHQLFTRRYYPEWTLSPVSIRQQLNRYGFQVLEEHAVFILGLFLGTHRPWFPFSRLLNRMRVIEAVKAVELSKCSRLLAFLAPQYVLVAVKTNS